MNRIGMLIDISHTSDDTFYDVLKHSKKPIVASHSSCRSLCSHRRNLSDRMIKDLASCGGVIQINFYPFFLQDGLHNREIDTLIDGMDYWQARFRNDLNDEVAQQKYYSIIERLKNYPSISYKLIADHIDHVVSLVGVEHVGLGSDFDGIEITPEGMTDASCFPVLIEELRTRGYNETDIERIAGGNFLRLL